MATLNIEGRNVNIDDGFLKLPPDQQQSTVEEIAKSMGVKAGGASTAQPQSMADYLPAAVKDVLPEVGNAYGQALQHLTGNSVEDVQGFDPRTRGQLGPIEGLIRTGRQIMGVPEFIIAPAVGAARSLIGHPMADAEHAIGTVVNPQVAAKDDRQKMYETAKGDVDLALSAAMPGKVAAPKAVAPTIPELKQAATANYESPDLTGLEVKPRTISDFATQAKVALDAGGLDENLAPKTHAILTKLEKVPNGPAAIVTGNNIKSLRQLLGNAAGEPGKEGLAASRALEALDQKIPAVDPQDVISGDPKAAGEALDTANADYSAAKHAETIDNKTIKAELRAAASNSGHNVANTIRQRMADILNPERPDLQRGFQPDELAMMEEIVRGTKMQNALRWAGNYLGGGGGLGALHTSAAGAGVGASIAGPFGAVIGAVTPPALGYVLKALGNSGTLADAAKLSEMIRSRAPLASSTAKFNQAASSFGNLQNGRTYAAALMAARNLSNNLRSAGFNISPVDLLKSLQSPGNSNAQDQQEIPRPPSQ